MIDKNLEEALNIAYIEAKERRHEFFTLEHLLFALLQTDMGEDIIVNTGGSIESLIEEIEDFLEQMESLSEQQQITDPIQTLSLQRLLQKIIFHAQSAEKEKADIGDVFVSLFDEDESYAKYILEKEGITRLAVLNFISHGITKDEDLWLEDGVALSDMEDDDDMDWEDEDSLDEESAASQAKKEEKLLERFTVNMTAEARQDKYDSLIGREDELRRTIEVLMRRVKNNPLHVGEAGVGKTAITQGLAQLIAQKKVPRRLKEFEIYGLDLGSMLAGTRYRGDFEERLKGILKILKDRGNVILFIDEIHTIIGAGSVQGGSMDASNMLKPILGTGELRCIGSTTYDEYQKYFIKDRAFSRRFQKIDIVEPTVTETNKILTGLKDRYESFHELRYSKNAIKSASELSAKYLTELHLPDKAIDILDEAAASVKIYSEKRNVVTQSDVEKLVARMARIPLNSITQQEKSNLIDLDNKLKTRVYGQDNAVARMAKSIKRHRAGLGQEEKPIGSFLFIGPTGVGKTELARALSDELAIPLLRFDMSEYMEKHTISRLLGSPPGYVGFDQGAMLTDQIRKSPHSVLLLDEIEKAHPDIYNSLLQVMDHATLTDNTGRTADFRNVILIMTSNAGSKEMSSWKIGFDQGGLSGQDPMNAVKKTFTPEFRNRLDSIILFGRLGHETVLTIVNKFVRELAAQLASKKIQLELLPAAQDLIAQWGYSVEYGARPMSRIIQEQIKDPLVDEILSGALKQGGKVTINGDKEQDKLTFHYSHLERSTRQIATNSTQK